MIKIIFKNIQTGKYIETWKYSQGNLSHTETSLPAKAADFLDINPLWFTILKKRGFVKERYMITLTRLEDIS